MAAFQLASDAAELRAKRRAQVALVEATTTPDVPYVASVADGARLLVEAFERGDDLMMGYPRHLVDFDRAYRSLQP